MLTNSAISRFRGGATVRRLLVNAKVRVSERMGELVYDTLIEELGAIR